MSDSEDPRKILEALIAQKIRAGFNMGERAIDEIKQLFGFDRPILKDRSDGISKAIANIELTPGRYPGREEIKIPCSETHGRSTEVPIDSPFYPPSDEEIRAAIEDLNSREIPLDLSDETLRLQTAMYQSNWIYLEVEPPHIGEPTPRPSARYIWDSSPSFETMNVAQLGVVHSEEMIVTSESSGGCISHEMSSVRDSLMADIDRMVAPDVHKRCAGCDFYSGSKELRCAVKPDGDPDECMHFEAIADKTGQAPDGRDAAPES